LTRNLKKKKEGVLLKKKINATLCPGIYVDAPSFNDEGYGPVPAKWKGKCVKGANFTGCNKYFLSVFSCQ